MEMREGGTATEWCDAQGGAREVLGKLAEAGVNFPADAQGEPCALDELVLYRGKRVKIVAMTHKGKLAVRGLGSHAPTIWVRSRDVAHAGRGGVQGASVPDADGNEVMPGAIVKASDGELWEVVAVRKHAYPLVVQRLSDGIERDVKSDWVVLVAPDGRDGQ